MKCFRDPAAYAFWRAGAPPLAIPCVDCTPAHKAAMLTQGRCERPEVVFVVREGGLVGMLPAGGGKLLAREPRNTTSSEESAFVVRVAAKLLGEEAVAGLVQIQPGSLHAYRRGVRVLPHPKLDVLRAAVRRAALLVTRPSSLGMR